MKPWEIWSFQPPGWAEPHPAVIVSHASRVSNKAEFNVLICSTHRATREPKEDEVLLDQADGLDWETLCRCDLLFLAPKTAVKNKRGQVTAQRRRQIILTMIRANDWLL